MNLAPFSSFTWVSIKPPMVAFTVGLRDGVRKDTSRNIVETGEFVVHVADESLLDALHESGENHPPDVSEVELLGLQTAASDFIAVPRLTQPRIAMECRLHQTLTFGVMGADFIVGEVLAYHVNDAIIHDGKIDTVKLNPVCRLGGPNYAMLGEVTSRRAMPYM